MCGRGDARVCDSAFRTEWSNGHVPEGEVIVLSHRRDIVTFRETG
jgi:hypothetical protein